MPWYGPNPADAILEARKSKRHGNTNLYADGLQVNFRRKPWDPTIEAPEAPEFEPLTLGDAEFNVHDYLIDAQVPSAHAETVAEDARTQALEALEQYGASLDPETKKKLEEIAQAGQPPRKSNAFMNVLNVLDTLGESARLGVVDLFADSEAGFEVTGQDYVDAFLGNEEKVRERHGDKLGEDQFLASGTNFMDLINPVDEASDTQGFTKVARGVGGFFLDVLLDPTTYASFGTVGLGKKVAIEAAQAGISRSVREATEAIARNSVSQLSDPMSKEAATRILGRIETSLDDLGLDPAARSFGGRNEVTSRILAEERRAVAVGDPASDLSKIRSRFFDDTPDDTFVPRGTVTEGMATEVFRELADKNFRNLASKGWYTQSRHIPGYAKGGIQFGAPFGRKRFPMLRIPGTETNRLASALLGRKQAATLFSKLPDKAQQIFRYVGRRTGVEKTAFEAAREGNLWKMSVAQNLANLLEEKTFTAEALRPLAHGKDLVETAAAKHGIDKTEASRLLRAQLAGDYDALEGIHDEVKYAVREAIDGDAEKGVDGIRQVFQTFHDAARRVGMDIGHEPNYVPLVVNKKFGQLLDGLSNEGVNIPLGRGSSPLSNLGLAILARYTHNAGETAIDVAGTNPTYAKFAQSNRVTRLFRGAVGSQDLTEDPNMFELVRAAGSQRMSADLANDAVAAALDDLTRLTGMSRSRTRGIDEAFHTDLETIFSAYTESMGEAIRMQALLRELRRMDLVRAGERKLAVSNTLESVRGRLTDETIEFIERVAAGEGGAQRASRLVTEKIGGRSVKLPAVVVAHPNYRKTARQLDRAFSRLDKRGPEIRQAVAAREAELVAEGWPKEVAQKLAISVADSDIGTAFSQIADMALEEIRVLNSASLEMGARQIVDGDEAMTTATEEARRILVGANDALRELDEKVRSALNMRPPASEAVDVGATTMKTGQPMLSVMVDQFMRTWEQKQGRFLDHLATSQPTDFNPGRMAQEAGRDLADRLTVHNVTVGEVAKFGNPGALARVLYEVNQRILGSGYRGVESLTDEMVEATEEVLLGEFMVLEAQRELGDLIGRGGVLTEAERAARDTARQGVKDAEAALKAADAKLREAATPLTQSTEQLGELVDHAAETIRSADESMLHSPEWLDVWAVATQKQKVPQRVIKEEAKLEGVAPTLKSTDVSARGAKGAAREDARNILTLWKLAMNQEEQFLARQALMLEDVTPPRITQALHAMASGDLAMLARYDTEFRQIVGAIADKDGRTIFDPGRFAWREDGALVMEGVDRSFVTLDDVMDDIKAFVDQKNITDLERLRIARITWDDNAELIEGTFPKLATFFRQMDARGGLPQEIEDYEYLRSFIGDLKAQVPDATKKPKAAPRPVQSNLEKVVDEAAAVLRRESGHGPRARKLDRLWDASRADLEKTLPPEVYERVLNLVSVATGSREIGLSPFPGQLRSLVGSADQAYDQFTRDVAAIRMQGGAQGEAWSDSVIEDVLAFRAAYERLQQFAPADQAGRLTGQEDLVDVGGEFNEALDAYRQAGHKVLNDLRRTEKKPQLASFLPELPESADGLPKFIEAMADEMLGWRPDIVGVPGKDYVNSKIPGLVGESTRGLEMTPATALMLEHLATASVAVASPLGIRLTAETMREIEKWWKSAATVARPTFVPRNMIGGVLNGLMIGVGPRHYAAVRTNVMKFKRAYDDTGSFEQALDAVDKNFRPYMEGLAKSRLLETTFASSLNRLRVAPKASQLVNPFSSDNALFRVGARIMENSEDFLRAAAFVRWYDPKNPASMKLAREIALVAHFDYGALTRLESGIKRFVPFFVWTRRNLPLQMRMMMEQPGAITRILHAQQNVNDTWGEDNFVDEMGFARSPYLSSFTMETPFIFEEDTPYWQRLLVDPQIPVTDLEEAAKAFGNGYGGILDYALRMVSPVYSTPFEINGEQDDVAAPTGLREIMLAADQIPGVDPRTSSDEYLVDPGVARLFSTALPFLGEWTRTAGLVPSGARPSAAAGYNTEDGVSMEERIRAVALSLARAGGATLQTPADTRAAGYEAIFGEIEPAIDNLHLTGQYIEGEDVEAYINALLSRAGVLGQEREILEMLPQAPPEEEEWDNMDEDFIELELEAAS